MQTLPSQTSLRPSLRRSALRAALSSCAVLALCLSCTSTDSAGPSTFEERMRKPEERQIDPAPRAMLKRLRQVVGKDEELAEAVGDVRLILEAQSLQDDHERERAVARWFQALGKAEGRFGQKAFEGWLDALMRHLDRKMDRAVLARLVMAETRQGQVSPYMRSKNYTSEEAIMPLLLARAGSWIEARDSASGALAPPLLAAPRTAGIPVDDPLLTKTASQVCKAKAQDLADWQRWIGGLGEETRSYWNALILHCSGQNARALAAFRETHPKLAQNPKTQNLAVEAASRQAALERALDQKSKAADTYLSLMELWEKPAVTASAMGLARFDFLLRHIDEALWAARYRALIADYENAKRFAQRAIDLIATAAVEPAATGTLAKERLATLRAEGYHVLAFRIAVEQRAYDSAAALNMLALQSAHLERSWIDRLQWFAAFYDYLGNNRQAAQSKWEALLAQTSDDSIKASTLFWLARLADRDGRLAVRDRLMGQLVASYPLSYYAIVAPGIAGFGETSWASSFKDADRLQQRLVADPLASSPGLEQPKIRRSLARANAMAAAELGEWARLAVGELEAAMAGELPMARHPEAWLQVSRLHYSSGNFLAAIGLTTKLAKAYPELWRRFPEQLFVYFPRPYLDTYRRNALENALDPELLLGISRQESGFTASIRSSANAFGIMQLILPTASRFSDGLDAREGELEELLSNPAANIRMGSKFLRHLSLRYKGFGPAIFGAYNAGEYAMNGWLTRRAQSDPLAFVELVPFGETKDYIKNVWRNLHVYKFLNRSAPLVQKPKPSSFLGRLGQALAPKEAPTYER